MREQLNAKREELATALHAAKAISAEGTASAEGNSKFQKAMDDVRTLGHECQAIENQISVANTELELSTPQGPKVVERAVVNSKVNQEHAVQVYSAYLRKGEKHARELAVKLNPTEAHALLTSTDTAGGFAVPDDFQAELLVALAGFAVARSAGVRVVQTSSDKLIFPTLVSGTDPYSSDIEQSLGGTNWNPEGTTTGGTAPPNQTKPTFGQASIPVHTWMPDVIELTQELIEDSAVNLESIIANLLGEIKGLDEDLAILLGNGTDKPQGILDKTGVGTTTVTGLEITYTGLVDLWTSLPAQYRTSARFVMNSKSYGDIVKLEGTTSKNLIFQPIRGNTPNNLFGTPVVFSEFMEDAGTNLNQPIIHGDFRFYILAERRGLTLQRLSEKFAPNVGILARARIGGDVVRTDAFKTMTVAT